MDKKLYKCFTCGKLYDSEEQAIKCHNAPVQQVLRKSGMNKPRFLGN